MLIAAHTHPPDSQYIIDVYFGCSVTQILLRRSSARCRVVESQQIQSRRKKKSRVIVWEMKGGAREREREGRVRCDRTA